MNNQMKPQNKDKVKELLGRLNSLENSSFPDVKSLSDEIIHKEYSNVTDTVKNNSTVKMLDAINSKLEAFKVDFDLKPVSSAISDFQDELGRMKEENGQLFSKISSDIEEKVAQINSAIENARMDSKNTTDSSVSPVWGKVNALQAELSTLSERKIEIPDFGKQITSTETKIKKLINALKSEVEGSDKSEGLQKQITELQESIKTLRTDLLSRLAGIGGGNMNRNIAIGGNTSVLSRYADINIKAGANVTLTYTNNNTTKYLDLTIAATGGGGGGGITRSINNISTNTVAGSTASTDYVYLVSGTTTLTLPDAATVTNLYTIKNVGTGTVTVNTTSAQTIDGSATASLPVRYTSIDLESDGSNWNVT